MESQDEEILHSVENGVGTLVLNRPRALNSLTLNMVRRVHSLVAAWSKPDSGVSSVLIRGAGEKAFCAGGDVKAVVLSALAGDYSMPDAFFSSEYDMDLTINRLPIPYVALIDGIVMGGGVGISINGMFRVATERTVLAMPECAIGLFPDVGAAAFLSKLPGHLGLYLGLTGARITGVTVRECGLATHFLPSSALPRVIAALQQLTPQQQRDVSCVAHVLDRLEADAGPLPTGELRKLLPLVKQHFGHPSVPAILASLEAAQTVLPSQAQADEATAYAAQFVNSSLAALRKGSPLSEVITFELLQRAAHAPLAAVLLSDKLMNEKFARGAGDFHEGVKAVLIDKTQTPKWQYCSVQQVPAHVVESFFDGGPFARSSTLQRQPNNAELPCDGGCHATQQAACTGDGLHAPELGKQQSPTAKL